MFLSSSFLIHIPLPPTTDTTVETAGRMKEGKAIDFIQNGDFVIFLLLSSNSRDTSPNPTYQAEELGRWRDIPARDLRVMVKDYKGSRAISEPQAPACFCPPWESLTERSGLNCVPPKYTFKD